MGPKSLLHIILQHRLHLPVAFIILPLFALANTNISLTSHWYQALITTNGIGIILGLAAGKPAGILIFSFVSGTVCNLVLILNKPYPSSFFKGGA
ncbi:MAG TPA: Na+/H+ antiporter NhaA [Chryseosolibacter sp.]|nr:Na+/H+ antiporter NhaA [Chryseosolibacter sp.]